MFNDHVPCPTEPATEELAPAAPESVATIEVSPTAPMTPPQFVEVLGSVEANDGQEVQMVCKVIGSPMPQISWFHDSKNIDEDEEFVISYNPDTGVISLIIVEVFPEDQGQYICIAQNPAGRATSSSYLSVVETAVVEEEEVTEEVTEVEFTDALPCEEPMDVEKPTEMTQVSEEQVVPQVIDRPKVKPLVEEETIESPIPDSICSDVTSELYETCPESPICDEVLEEITEPKVVSKKINRPKVVPLEPERVPESPLREIVIPDEPMEEELDTPTGEEVTEEVVMPQMVTREVKIPEITEKVTEVALPVEEVPIEETEVESQEVTFVISAEPQEIMDAVPSEKAEISETEVKEPPEEIAPIEEESVEFQFQITDEIPQQIITPETAEEISPEFVEMLQPQIVEDGGAVLMSCRLVGSPAPTVTWYKSTIQIEPSPDFKLTYEPETGVCTLELAEVFPEDAGEYVCKAVNPFGEATTSATLLVRSKWKT